MWATKIIKVLRKKKKPFAYLPYLLVSHASSIKCFENRLIFDPPSFRKRILHRFTSGFVDIR
jgi:hypothetical protein